MYPVGTFSVFTLKRTDTTLDLSQTAEKVRPTTPPPLHHYPLSQIFIMGYPFSHPIDSTLQKRATHTYMEQTEAHKRVVTIAEQSNAIIAVSVLVLVHLLESLVHQIQRHLLHQRLRGPIKGRIVLLFYTVTRQPCPVLFLVLDSRFPPLLWIFLLAVVNNIYSSQNALACTESVSKP